MIRLRETMIPHIPGWDGLHPFVAHYPIALLSAVPLPIVVGLLLPKRGRGFFITALVLMVLGTVSAFVAVSTGHAAARLADQNADIAHIFELHEQLAVITPILFSVLTILLAAVVIVPALLKRKLPRIAVVAFHLVLLLAISASCLLLMNAAHYGGVLVHNFGVHADIGDPPSVGDLAGDYAEPAAPPSSSPGDRAYSSGSSED